MQTQIFFPKIGKPPFPVFYLLHGLSDDSTAWQRNTRLEAYAAAYPMIIVMPDGYRGFYTDNEQGPAYGKYMTGELIEIIERTFAVKPGRAHRAIGGLSMGGYGALRIALAHPDKFCSVNSHSGAVHCGSTTKDALRRYRKYEPRFRAELKRVFGTSGDTEHDLRWLARKVKAARQLPKILLDCGTDDFLIEENRAFARDLTEIGVPHIYREFEGVHDWDYWDLHIREALAFHATNLKIKTLA